MPTFFALSRIIQRVDELLRPAMEKTFWVKAEISSSRSKGGHFYCDLVESNEKGQVNTQVRCTIWAKELTAIRQKFRSEGLEFKLEDGIHIGMLCRIQFHPIYGLSFRGLDMDPAFMLGEMELKKREIIDRLKKRGLMDLNKETFLPSLPQKIGLITGENTAAYEDFMNTLQSSGFGFKISFAGSTMQGENTAISILKSLATLSQLNLDLVIICRGGGSKVDLSWLDHEGIAEHIAHFQIPVWTGIGHEIDTSVLDYVAAQAFKTPTAIAEELVSIHEGMQQWINQAKHNLQSTWNFRYKEAQQEKKRLTDHLKRESLHLLEMKRSDLQLNLEQMQSRVQQQLSEAKSDLLQAKQNLRLKVPQKIQLARSEMLFRAKHLRKESLRQVELQKTQWQQKRNRLSPTRFEKILSYQKQHWQQSKKRLLKGPLWSRLHQETEKLKSYGQTLHASSPETQLSRGFSMIQDNQGKTLTRADHIETGQEIQLKLKDGSIKAKVTSKENSTN